MALPGKNALSVFATMGKVLEGIKARERHVSGGSLQ